MPGRFEFYGSLFDFFALACNRQQVNGFNVNGGHGSVPFLFVSADLNCSLEFFRQALHRHHEGDAIRLHHHSVVLEGDIIPPLCFAAESAQASAVAYLLPVVKALSSPKHDLARWRDLFIFVVIVFRITSFVRPKVHISSSLISFGFKTTARCGGLWLFSLEWNLTIVNRWASVAERGLRLIVQLDDLSHFNAEVPLAIFLFHPG
jgi:hypothetical protein